MYSYNWDEETGGILLNTTELKFSKEPRPVYYKELDLLGFDEHWTYAKDDSRPYLWAEANVYYYRGKKVAQTRGGSLYTKPEIEILADPEPKGEALKFVDIEKMIAKNKEIVDALANSAIKWIYNTYEENKKKMDVFYVAFSGGKDSIVLLDLVQQALPHEAIKVLFGDTGMEFSDTYSLIDTVSKELKQKQIVYIHASANIKAIDSWRLFGPPAQKIRWCCSVHKTAPQIIALRKHLNKANFRGLAYIGIRGDESASRNEYKQFECGKKHNGQCSAYPILEWNSAELFLYIYQRGLLLNEAYKMGNSRVGCLVCPLAANKNEYFKFCSYKAEMQPFLDIITDFCCNDIKEEAQSIKYLDYGGWKARKSGTIFRNKEGRYVDAVEHGKLIISVKNANCDWKIWAPTAGYFEELGNDIYSIENLGYKLEFSIVGDKTNYCVNASATDIAFKATFFRNFKQIFKKAAYCNNCGECESNCTNGCISTVNKKIQISNCKHCTQCHEIENGCLLYHSNRKSKEGNMNNKSINRYGNLAPQKEWIEAFIDNDGEYEKTISLGTNKIKSFGSFLRDADLIKDKRFSYFASVVKKAGLNNNDIGWALIFVNLVYSPEFNWFIKTLRANMSREEFEELARQSGEYSNQSQAPNHISQAFVIFSETPFGRLGLGQTITLNNKKKVFSKTSWANPDSRIVLYALYRFAEECEGYYQFSLDRLMDFDIDIKGISPAQIFGLDEKTIGNILSGLSAKYPEFISYSETLGMRTINLRKDKSAQSVLELF